MIKSEAREGGCHDQGKTEFPLEVAPECVGTGLRGQGGYKSHSKPVGASKRVGRGKRVKEKEQERKSQGSSSEVLLFYGENSRLSTREIQFAFKSPFSSGVWPHPTPQSAPGHPPTDWDSWIIA